MLSTHYEEFNKCDDKDEYDWRSSIKKYVTGKSTSRVIKTEFIKSVDVLYVPMKWGESHWVGLIINLNYRHIEVLDTWIEPTPYHDVPKLIAPVMELILWVVKSFISPLAPRHCSTTPFTWVVAKLLEMHAHGLGVEELVTINDRMVTESICYGCIP